jgi:hypothetical protein
MPLSEAWRTFFVNKTNYVSHRFFNNLKQISNLNHPSDPGPGPGGRLFYCGTIFRLARFPVAPVFTNPARVLPSSGHAC